MITQADICSSSTEPTESIHAVVGVGVDNRFTELDRTVDESAAVIRGSVADTKSSAVQVESSRLRGEDMTTGELRFDLSLGAPGSRSRCGALGTYGSTHGIGDPVQSRLRFALTISNRL
jgi:hypothetical protein